MTTNQQDQGVSGRFLRTGLSQVEPVPVSPVPASIPSAWRVVSGIVGVAMFFGGFSLFGLGFDVIDATRAWELPSYVVMPAIMVAVCVVTFFVVVGMGLITMAAQGIVAGTDETLQAAQPEGQEPGSEGMRPAYPYISGTPL